MWVGLSLDLASPPYEEAIMSKEAWMELEYQQLRAEILALIEAEQSTTRFFLPAAAAVYAIPYVLQQTSQMFLWSVCAGLAGLLIVAMSYTLFASVDGIRRIGMYIKEAIEPRTNGGLRWESIVHFWDQRQTHWWPSEHAIIAAGAVVTNVAAAAGAGHIFLKDIEAIVPAAVAAVIGGAAIPTISRMAKSARQRDRYAKDVASIVARLNGGDASAPAG
jgi:hypothetical protein